MVEVFFAYTQVFLMVCSLIAVIVGIIQRKRHKEMRFVVYYPLASLIETFSSPIINVEFPKLRAIGVADMSANIFLLIEFIIIYHYFIQILTNKKVKKSLYVISFIYLPIMAIMWVCKKTFNSDPEVLFVPQALCVLYPTFCYFIESLKASSKLELRSEPSFWMTTGIMIYFGCTLPLFLLNDIIDFHRGFERSIYSINFLCYALLFILITNAYLCKKKEAPL